MIYLVPEANCVCLNKNLTLLKGAKYKLPNPENFPLVFLAKDSVPLTLNLYEICCNFVNGKNLPCQNVCKFNADYFVFLNFKPVCNSAFHTIDFKNNKIAISLSQMLTVSINGEVLAEMPNFNLTYSHFEKFNNFCVIYFLGRRNFVAVVKDGELFYANYYDKFECSSNEYYFLTFLKDGLNHGKVCHIGANESEQYLVYLDEYNLNLKPEFLPHIFLDCLLAGNYKYCNALLCQDLKQNEPSEIANFFCEFERFYPLDNLTFALIKKDAVVGIYQFEIENNEIVNISETDFF